jgi:ParB-like chromosome segregation protein Spo0J
MSSAVKIAFQRSVITLPLTAILPRKKMGESVKRSVKYRRIAASIAEVGIIEPIVVTRVKGQSDSYMLLDGHVRLEIIQKHGVTSVDCLVASDDEGFTYNKRVNHLATVQEHFMIVRALKGGVSREKLASALNVNISRIEQRRALLDGISPDVVELLKDRHGINPLVFRVLKKMKPARQVIVVELMLSVNNITSSYAQALLAGTRAADLKDGHKAKQLAGLTPEQMARMERETEALQVDFKAIEASHGDDVLNLMIACGYVSKILRNAAIERYLVRREGDLVEQLRDIIAATSPDRDWMQIHETKAAVLT